MRVGMDFRTFTQYAILGDDIVIAHQGVAAEYQDIMKILGVGISPSKSFFGFGISEFAKSLYINGLNVSPIPASLLKLADRFAPYDALALACEMKARDVNVPLRTLILAVPMSARELTCRIVTCPVGKYYYPSNFI